MFSNISNISAKNRDELKRERMGKFLLGFVSLLLLRYLYLYLVISILENAWYTGTGGYGIEFSPNKEVASVAVYLAICLVISRLYSETSLNFRKLVALVLMIMYIMPVSCSYSLNNLEIDYFIASNVYAILLLYLLCKQDKKVSRVDLTSVRINEVVSSKAVASVCAVLCIVLILYKISYNGLDFNLSLDGDDVYANRAEYAEYKGAISGSLFGYLLVILLNVTSYVAPLYCYISLQKRNYFGAILALAAVLSTFSLASGKGGLFFLGILVMVVIAERFQLNISNPGLLINAAMIALFAIAILDYHFIHSNALFMTIIRRAMYIPAWMGSLYFEFFTNNPPLLLSDSAFLFQTMIPSSYGESALDLISNTYFNGAVPSPNTGMLAEAVMQFGYVGIVIFPFVAYAILKWGGREYEKFGSGVSLLVAAQTVIQLINVPVLRTDFILSFVLLAAILKYIDMHTAAGKKAASCEMQTDDRSLA